MWYSQEISSSLSRSCRGVHTLQVCLEVANARGFTNARRFTSARGDPGHFTCLVGFDDDAHGSVRVRPGSP